MKTVNQDQYFILGGRAEIVSEPSALGSFLPHTLSETPLLLLGVAVLPKTQVSYLVSALEHQVHLAPASSASGLTFTNCCMWSLGPAIQTC